MSDPSPAGRTDWFTRFLLVACTLLALLVVLLTVQNLRLKSDLARAHGASPPEGFEPGDPFGEVALIDEAGEPVSFDFAPGDGRTLVLVFTATCPACRQTMPIWKQLLGDASFPGVRIVGLQLDLHADGGSASVALEDPLLPFPVYGVERGRSDALAKVPVIPTTLLLDAGGVVRHVWFGVPSDDDQQRLRAALQAS
jgi:thiol-disulfide isomerase/thioredoxin